MQTVSSPPLLIRAITAAETYPLRHAVLWPDKPLDFVRIADDDSGYHFGAFRGAELVAVISLFGPDAPGGLARFRKFATHPDHQRQGIGSALLAHSVKQANHLGASGIWCDARLDAAPLYRRFGMEPEGGIFYKGSIPYSRMSRLF